jgi:opacity protein-like surface antigen
MKKLMLASAALSAFSNVVDSVSAADMPPFVAPIPIFTWTSCFLGAHIGGGWAQKDFTDPVALVQNSLLGTVTTGVTTVGVSSSGLLVGGQMGCDYQFGLSPWVLGLEGAVSGMNLRGNTNFGLPLGGPSDIATMTAKTDFLPSVTARFGYALANWLFYVRAGGAWAGAAKRGTPSATLGAFIAHCACSVSLRLSLRWPSAAFGVRLEIARSTSPWWDSRAPAEQTGDIVIVRTVAAPKDKPK